MIGCGYFWCQVLTLLIADRTHSLFSNISAKFWTFVTFWWDWLNFPDFQRRTYSFLFDYGEAVTISGLGGTVSGSISSTGMSHNCIYLYLIVESSGNFFSTISKASCMALLTNGLSKPSGIFNSHCIPDILRFFMLPSALTMLSSSLMFQFYLISLDSPSVVESVCRQEKFLKALKKKCWTFMSITLNITDRVRSCKSSVFTNSLQFRLHNVSERIISSNFWLNANRKSCSNKAPFYFWSLLSSFLKFRFFFLWITLPQFDIIYYFTHSCSKLACIF